MYHEHREKLFEAMDEGVLFVPAANVLLRNADTDHSFRQDSDFQYLTGFPEPDAIAVFEKKGRRRRFTLFVAPRDPALETWTGIRAGTKGAKADYGADRAFNLDEFDGRLGELLQDAGTLYLPLGPGLHAEAWRKQATIIRKWHTDKYRRKQALTLPDTVRDSHDLIAALRLRKSEAEIEAMRRAAALTAEAFSEAMALAEPGCAEYELKALMNYVYGRGGGTWAFDTIVAGGANGCVLHYVSCRDRLEKGQLVTIDSGAEVEGYACDVTRTFPVGGRFSPVQKKVYLAVLRAMEEAIAVAVPGNTIADVHEKAVEVLIEELLALGALKGTPATVRKRESWKRYFPHGTGHWLGGDTHDVGGYADGAGPTVLEPGMVITVEPGLYFPPGDKRLPKGLGGIGIRIEDDILITEKGNENLTAAIPKSLRAVEAACKGRLRILRRPGR